MRLGKILGENRSFRFYWASISLSHISGIMFNVISAYILLLVSPSFYSLVVGVTMLVGALIRLPSGYLSDSLDRRKALMLTRLSQAVLILLPILSLKLTPFSYVGFNLLTSLNGPLSAGLVQSVMEKRQVLGGTSLNSLTISISSVVGGLVSLSYPVLGITAFLSIASVMRLFTVFFIGNVRVKARKDEPKGRIPVSLIIYPILVFSFLDVIPVMMNSLVFVVSSVEPSLALVSLLTTLGNGMGAILTGERIRENSIGIWARTGSLLLGLVLVAISLSPLYLVYVLLVLRGILSSIQSISIRSDLRLRVSNNLMGRTWGLITTISSFVASVVALSYSFIVSVTGTRFPVLVLGLSLLTLGILMVYRGPSNRQDTKALGSEAGVREESSGKK
ncbi:major facilitator superfamily MFS_1 [Metallosphaera sedula]|uniref:Major facilitator superfamily MFS_1 n=3 Tax=Metallosphaera TaxID=41980 RepID=A4YIA2_METS5|nr:MULTISPECIES: MFS transporter [Metallosphaera]ABP96154.1 major facilitator superfamily MFS_1 [Metallosphaera sedula DSM 5348]AIM28137.1 major facilitator superfamily MFS_1 [Metallosphaera sedula]AKV74961.1 hypothetical protein MsedA_2063 [Metallosphaera sedula]AKV77199.1 hypothetical protein MsedB_2065 [Metallosphaera sedula]AKV79449.1 hypothetical protein MsedC_2063 [Metallosphaera sedula]